MKKVFYLFSAAIFLLSAGVKAESRNFDLLSIESANSEAANILSDSSLNMVWVIIDQVSLDELISADTPNIDLLQEKGAFSLMNVRTAGHLESESTYLSANTGNRCQGSKMSHNAVITGNGVVNDKIYELKRINSSTEYKAEPGLLGDLAEASNVEIAVLGNSDIKGENIRTIVSMAMDSSGYIPLARIDKSILQETESPWGYQSDYISLGRSFLELKDTANAIFIETGDISRIEYYYHNFNKNGENYEKKSENSVLYNKYSEFEKMEYKIRGLKKIDKFIGFLINNLDMSETQVGVLSLTPSKTAVENGYRLGWLLLAGRGVEQGWLSSTSTRRRGIITIADLLSIFLSANGIDSPASYMKSSEVVPAEKNLSWSALKNLNERLVLIYKLRPPFIKTFILLQIIVLIMAIVKMVFKYSKNLIIFSPFFEYLLLAILLVPVNTLLVSLLQISNMIYLVVLQLLLLVFEEFLLLKHIKDRLIRLLYISWPLVILIFIDLLANYRMLADSLLGYSSIIGARYYGIGNEYMGFYLGAFLLAVTAFLEFFKKKKNIRSFSILILIFIFIYSIGAVNLGANFGGMVTAILACGVTLYYIGNWNKYYIFLTGLLFLLFLILIDFSGIMGTSSHIGNAVANILKGEWQWIKDIIFRKFAMNIKLLKWTIWTRVLLVMIVYLIVLVKRPTPKIKSFFEGNPYLKAGIYGTLAGSLITMFVNDSGVVAAATLLFYPVMSLLYLSFSKDDFKTGSGIL